MALNNLSKSKLLAYRQCPKRLWLEIHRRDLIDLDAGSQSAMLQGHEVGAIARKIYDPEERGHFLDLEKLGFRALFKHSEALVEEADTPLFETGFSANGALALADILLPVSEGKDRAWRMVEVKSSTSVKDYHRDDVAIQAYVVRAAGVPLQCGEPDSWSTFRLGLFGLDKLDDVSGTIERLEHALDRATTGG